MKRPLTLLLAAALFASASAYAAKNDDALSKKIAREVVRGDNANRGHEGRNGNHRGNDNRGNDRGRDQRGNDNRNDRGNDNRGNDRGRDHRGNDNRGHDRRDDRRPGGHDRNGHRDDRHGNNNRGWDRPRNDWSNHPNYWDNRRHDRRDHARYRYHFGHYRPPAGYYHRAWHRGDHLPRAWYGHSYVVYDWRPYRLYSPPHGYHWVRVGNDVILTAIATGLVLDVLYGIWY